MTVETRSITYQEIFLDRKYPSALPYRLVSRLHHDFPNCPYLTESVGEVALCIPYVHPLWTVCSSFGLSTEDVAMFDWRCDLDW